MYRYRDKNKNCSLFPRTIKFFFFCDDKFLNWNGKIQEFEMNKGKFSKTNWKIINQTKGRKLKRIKSLRNLFLPELKHVPFSVLVNQYDSIGFLPKAAHYLDPGRNCEKEMNRNRIVSLFRSAILEIIQFVVKKHPYIPG